MATPCGCESEDPGIGALKVIVEGILAVHRSAIAIHTGDPLLTERLPMKK
jgi:hypothetical protein